MSCDRLKVYRYTLSIIGVLIGASVFPVFGFIYQNWPCAAWGLASGVFAAITLGIHVQFYQDEWRRHSNRLRPLMYLGCFGQFAAVVGFVTSLILAITRHQKLLVHGDGYYLACIWCFMTWKWAFLLFYYCRRYRRQHEATTGTSSDISYEKI